MTISVFWFIFYILTTPVNNELISLYNNRQSSILHDRYQEIIKIYPNKFEHIALRQDDYPQNIIDLIVKKEDRFFLSHPGINPISALRAIISLSKGNKNPSSSTITQQTVKILLNNEQNRNIKNKLKETFYSLALETHTKKEEVMNIYLNSIFFGNRAEGLRSAAKLYFDTTPEELKNHQIIQLLAIISSPSKNHPYTNQNIKASIALAKNLNVSINEEDLKIIDKKNTELRFSNFIKNNNSFELDNLNINYKNKVEILLTTDNNISTKSRAIIKEQIAKLFPANARSAAVVIIHTPRNKEASELIAIIGSPDPEQDVFGYQINMATHPRTIGSTIKPFIYAKSFETGLRPYTEVMDREYKYSIGTGFSLYPKNYDYKYRGRVNLHYALSNSLNVPTVKVLEYVGLNNFYSLLEDSLEFSPIQSMDNYQLGIALGGLEMDLLSLSYYFTIFPNEGQLRPLMISDNISLDKINGNNFNLNKRIFESKYVQLVNKILSDRKTGIEQFGLASNLNLNASNYAVKTGTSREYHDSWTIGYTPDFTVGVWLGNTEDTPMDNISGQVGAGLIWQDVMSLLLNSEYNKKTAFNFDSVKNFGEGETLEYGLTADDYSKQKYLLEDKQLILKPHQNDNFLFEEDMSIFLQASEAVDWYIDDKFFGNNEKSFFAPSKPGDRTIKAVRGDMQEEMIIFINSK